MSEPVNFAKDRATVRAALVLVEMNPVARKLVLDLIDRLYSGLESMQRDVVELRSRHWPPM